MTRRSVDVAMQGRGGRASSLGRDSLGDTHQHEMEKTLAQRKMVGTRHPRTWRLQTKHQKGKLPNY